MTDRMKRLGWMFLMMMALSQLVCCGRPAQQQSDAADTSSYIFTMGTVFEIRTFAEDGSAIIQEIEQALYACDDLISWREEGSLAAQFNSAHSADMSPISDVIETALQISEDSQGAFDMTVLPLSRLWDFDRMNDSEFDLSEMRVPDAADIAAALAHVDYRQLAYDEETKCLSSEDTALSIELGAIGKGYAIREAEKILKASDASGGMISAGSSIYVYGAKNDGSAFRVALRDPRGDENSAIGVLSLSDSTISTSGDYERYFEEDGVRYHHILDPRTGYPADSGLMQVTILCDDSVLGDALSTACFVLGLDEGMALAQRYGVTAIFVDMDKTIWYNDKDVLEIFEFTGEDSGYTLQEYNQTGS